MYFKIVDNRKLVLSAPLNTDQEIIESFIKKYLSKFANYIEKASKKILFSFEEKWTYILGEKMNLSYIGGFNTNHAKISGKKLWLLTKTESTTDYLNALKSYLKITLDEYLAKTQKIYEDKMQIPHHQWRITEKTHSWGTNNVLKRRIFYNWKLVFHKPEFVNYVIIHELAHHKEPNHSKAFWKIVEFFEPNFQSIKKALNNT